MPGSAGVRALARARAVAGPCGAQQTRGGRLAFDHPDAVDRLVLMDCIPISEHLARADARFATQWWHGPCAQILTGKVNRIVTPTAAATTASASSVRMTQGCSSRWDIAVRNSTSAKSTVRIE